MDFRSDNAHGCSPEIAAALAEAAAGIVSPYGHDPFTGRLRERVRTLFACEADVFPLATGTAANALAIATMTPPWGGVFCHEHSHIHRDEQAAPEFFSGGAKLIALPGDHGKLQPATLAAAIDAIAEEGRMARPSCLSLTQATEAGSVYSVDELRSLCSVAHERSMRVHVDGARFANALVSSGASPADLTWRAGVDVLSFGATKNGAFAAEALIVFDRSLAEELTLRIHRAGHRFSKMRFLSAQLDAYLTDDLWLRNARHANRLALKLAHGLETAGIELIGRVDANVVFVRIAAEIQTKLRERGFDFYEWPLFGDDAVRLVCGFSTTDENVEYLLEAIR